MLVDSRVSVHVKCFQVGSRVCLVLTMNIFMFSVSLLLASHHVHFHHLYSNPSIPNSVGWQAERWVKVLEQHNSLGIWKIRFSFVGKILMDAALSTCRTQFLEQNCTELPGSQQSVEVRERGEKHLIIFRNLDKIPAGNLKWGYLTWE